MPDLSWLIDEGTPLSRDFLWGVASSGFQVEGGYNRAGQPQNNWSDWERSGRGDPAGDAARFWEDWGRHLDLAEGIGLSAFRMSVEWTRLQPRPGAQAEPQALARYAAILAGCRSRGMEPVVTLHHFPHPAWLGPDPWLDGSGPPAFEGYVRAIVPALNRALEGMGSPPITWWVTINEPNAHAFGTNLLGGSPHGARPGPSRFRRALDQLLGAHVRAYRAIHDIYRRDRWPTPKVAFNASCMTVHAMDGGLLDLAVARATGVPRSRIPSHIEEARARWEDELRDLLGPRERLVDRLLARVVLPDLVEGLPTYLDGLFAGEGAAHDYVGIDYYVGPVAHYLRLPRRGRRNPLMADLWETTIRPEGLGMFLRANVRVGDRVPILVAENGMCTRARGGMNQRRYDGWTRPQFLRAHIAELLGAARAGVEVAGYLHWTLVDNYEWGSFEPRFGLYGMDRRGSPRILSRDADGEDSAGAYRDIVSALRAADGRGAVQALSGGGNQRARGR